MRKCTQRVALRVTHAPGVAEAPTRSTSSTHASKHTHPKKNAAVQDDWQTDYTSGGVVGRKLVAVGGAVLLIATF